MRLRYKNAIPGWLILDILADDVLVGVIYHDEGRGYFCVRTLPDGLKTRDAEGPFQNVEQAKRVFRRGYLKENVM